MELLHCGQKLSVAAVILRAKQFPQKKEKTIESYITENVPGVFWVYSSEEINLQEHKVMDGKTLLNGGSHG